MVSWVLAEAAMANPVSTLSEDAKTTMLETTVELVGVVLTRMGDLRARAQRVK